MYSTQWVKLPSPTRDVQTKFNTLSKHEITRTIHSPLLSPASPDTATSFASLGDACPGKSMAQRLLSAFGGTFCPSLRASSSGRHLLKMCRTNCTALLKLRWQILAVNRCNPFRSESFIPRNTMHRGPRGLARLVRAADSTANRHRG